MIDQVSKTGFPKPWRKEIDPRYGAWSQDDAIYQTVKPQKGKS
ncbi:hypothetical protein [Sulfitobacter sp. BSw21498]|nr:hypothetical protein [Sulfitobacter sp. BSw21498]